MTAGPVQQAYRGRRGGHRAARTVAVRALQGEIQRREVGWKKVPWKRKKVPWKRKKSTLEEEKGGARGRRRRGQGGAATRSGDGHFVWLRAGSDKVLVAVSRFFCFPIQIFFSGNVFSGQNPVERGWGPKSVGGPMRRERVQPQRAAQRSYSTLQRVRSVEIQRNWSHILKTATWCLFEQPCRGSVPRSRGVHSSSRLPLRWPPRRTTNLGLPGGIRGLRAPSPEGWVLWTDGRWLYLHGASGEKRPRWTLNS